jgi:hypothetical protein
VKIAYYAESPADQAALTILTEAVLGRKTESIKHDGWRHRGWPTVKTVLPSVLKEVHYHTDAEGLALIVDSNGTPPHSSAHEPPNAPASACRLCQLRSIADKVQRQVRPSNRQPLKIALGLAVPAIEAWLLCGVDPHVTEAAWVNGLKDASMPYTKGSLKHQLYGPSRPSLSIEMEVMKMAASRLATDLSPLERLFRDGFGALCKSLRSWCSLI